MNEGDRQQGIETWAKYESRQGRKATFDEIGDVVVLLSLPRMSLVVGHNLVIDGYAIHPLSVVGSHVSSLSISATPAHTGKMVPVILGLPLLIMI